MIHSFLRPICLILALAGAVVGVLLLVLHHEAAGAGGALSGLCGRGGGCDGVLTSRWAYFPPFSPGSGAGPVVPVALLGVAYFGALAVWFGIFGWSSGMPGVVEKAVAALLWLGAAGSAGFIVLMVTQVGSVCPWCLAAHALNFGLVGVATWDLTRAKEKRNGDLHPRLDRRIPLLAGCLLAALWSSAGLAHQWLSVRSRAVSAETALAEIEKDAGVLELAFYGQDPVELVLREDQGAGEGDRDPTRDAQPGYRNTLVVFGDAQCSACRRFHDLLDAKVLPAYGNHLRVVFKHLPLEDLHPEARRAALALEAARMQGKFWPMLEALYDRQEELGSLDYPGLAAQLGLDEDRFSGDMASDEAARRVGEDVALAERLGIEATPAVFLNGRPVSGSIRNLPGFWEAQAARLRTLREEKGQPWEAGRIAVTSED